MTDFKELREALDAVPLPHAWKVYKEAPNDHWFPGTTIGASDPNDARRVADTCRLRSDAELFAEFIAAADPDTVRSLLDRLEAAERDAERYRWLRTFPNNINRAMYGPCLIPNDSGLLRRDDYLDAAIDAAMKEQQP